MKIELVFDKDCPSAAAYTHMLNRLAEELDMEKAISSRKTIPRQVKEYGISLFPAWIVDRELLRVNPGDYEAIKKQVLKRMRIQGSKQKDDFSISIIIPTLNEAADIESLLQYLKQIDDCSELIVADAQSQDNTAALASKQSRVVLCKPGRGTQMNQGARMAKGDILWFLHADCRPHPQSVQAMKQALRDSNIAGGGFEYNLNHSGFRFRLTEYFSNRKNRLLRLLFGDMGIFVRREVFQRMGGYKEIPLMEDMDFCRRLKRFGRIVILPQRIETSARRWIEEGFFHNLLRNWALQGAWLMGASPGALAKYYTFK